MSLKLRSVFDAGCAKTLVKLQRRFTSLARKLEAFRDYYNGHRVHRAIAGLTPAQRAGALSPAPAALDHYGWQQHCRGLFELPVAA